MLILHSNTTHQNIADIFSLDNKMTSRGLDFEAAQVRLEKLKLKEKSESMQLNVYGKIIRNFLKEHCTLKSPSAEEGSDNNSKNVVLIESDEE